MHACLTQLVASSPGTSSRSVHHLLGSVHKISASCHEVSAFYITLSGSAHRHRPRPVQGVQRLDVGLAVDVLHQAQLRRPRVQLRQRPLAQRRDQRAAWGLAPSYRPNLQCFNQRQSPRQTDQHASFSSRWTKTNGTPVAAGQGLEGVLRHALQLHRCDAQPSQVRHRVPASRHRNRYLALLKHGIRASLLVLTAAVADSSRSCSWSACNQIMLAFSMPPCWLLFLGSAAARIVHLRPSGPAPPLPNLYTLRMFVPVREERRRNITSRQPRKRLIRAYA